MDKTCILIVDDNPEIREIINVLLGGEGFEVSEAENGAQALTLIEQQDFDLIILDIMMPAKWLSDMPENPGTEQCANSVFKCPHKGKR